jgi:hypothetical protein
MSVEAWTDVADDDPDHDSITATGTKLAKGAVHPAGREVYFTYTVTNPSGYTLYDIVVSDAEVEGVCLIEEIPPFSEVGCARKTRLIHPARGESEWLD